MTPDQIREIVKMTIDELTDRKLVRTDSYQAVLKDVESELGNFFNSTGDTKRIGYALRMLSDDVYIDIIFLHYRDGVTLERIAEVYDKDVSTIKRNKKRLILSLYDLMI